ncbi:aminodeoxychorismate lyase [Russula earlei]|uniref:Aminodeoxychorismate lyase n=1 Tax=Russula earlei TaxID=71964 RepID=A0ACC0TVM8_9AGAM|nr:aminodeoxychorismate lyase [Russula earlei]
MKRLLLFFVLILLIIGGIAAWFTFGSGTTFDDKSKYFIVEEGKTDKAAVLATLEEKKIVTSTTLFSLIASKAGVWDKLKPGKYEVKKGQSLLNIARMLKNNKQADIKLIINKLRTKEDLAKLISRNFVHDSATVMNFLTSSDSLQSYHVDTNTVFTLIIPDTYTFHWNTPLRRIFNRLAEEHDAFWSKNNRTAKAGMLGFTPEQVYTLASIVEEETNANDEKGNIASVYMNRYNKGMALGADPTVKYALRDFGLKRILFGHLTVASPYNTYRNKGLPPGPICTPSLETLDAVLNAPKTDYLFFVASSEFNGHHHFSSNFAEHSQYAKQYQAALTARMAEKKADKEPE